MSNSTQQTPSATREDTRTLLRTGGGIFFTGIVCGAILFLTGGMGPHGPYNNAGWFTLMVSLCCIPSGGFALILGIAKWFGDRSR